MFKNISGIQESVSDQVKEQILEDLRTGDKKISFPRSEDWHAQPSFTLGLQIFFTKNN